MGKCKASAKLNIISSILTNIMKNCLEFLRSWLQTLTASHLQVPDVFALV